MKRAILISSWALLMISATAWAQKATDWQAIATAYQDYAALQPSPKAEGEKVLHMMPNSVPCDGSQAGIPDLMIDGRYFDLLSKKAYSGDPIAAEIMFKLAIAVCGDGEHSEDMDIAIGKLIKPQPKLFLVLEDKYKVWLPGVLGNLGPDYVDEMAKSAKELQLRYDALDSATGVPSNIKNKCLIELKGQILDRESYQ